MPSPMLIAHQHRRACSRRRRGSRPPAVRWGLPEQSLSCTVRPVTSEYVPKSKTRGITLMFGRQVFLVAFSRLGAATLSVAVLV